MKTKLLLSCFFGICALLTTSCKMDFVKPISLPETGATLEGTIKYNGEEVRYAMVMVSDGKNTTAFGRVDSEGKYKVENVPLGDVLIAVNSDAARGDFQSAAMSGGVYKGPEAKGKGSSKGVGKFISINAKYFDLEKSGLKTNVVKGLNTYNIDIKP